jgi:hemerythrin-like domain-containing protein
MLPEVQYLRGNVRLQNPEIIIGYLNNGIRNDIIGPLQPHGFLMIEHRAIEKALLLMAKEKARMEEGTFDLEVVSILVEFIHVVADEMHHGKEEAILFPAVKGKDRSFEFDEITTTLMKEHAEIRRHLRTTRTALEGYLEGDEMTVETIATEFAAITDLYTRHVRKEDSFFFPSAMAVLTDEEKVRMEKAIIEFDRSFTLKRYERMIDESLKDVMS